ncbi:hypothetical protein OSB04_015602 [Centaurea solstitialis]|uniref:Uncharacterized protein n=1 Tax=Centaurea solstitialis TaxID=347529 RepID=A0AA38W7N2_9ASTR|nr:hypothetical protein OSB04_015602 [Centaurea solstitialis]
MPQIYQLWYVTRSNTLRRTKECRMTLIECISVWKHKNDLMVRAGKRVKFTMLISSLVNTWRGLPTITSQSWEDSGGESILRHSSLTRSWSLQAFTSPITFLFATITRFLLIRSVRFPLWYESTLRAISSHKSLLIGSFARTPAMTTTERGSINDLGHSSPWNTFSFNSSQLSSSVKQGKEWRNPCGFTCSATSLRRVVSRILLADVPAAATAATDWVFTWSIVWSSTLIDLIDFNTFLRSMEVLTTSILWETPLFMKCAADTNRSMISSASSAASLNLLMRLHRIPSYSHSDSESSCSVDDNSIPSTNGVVAVVSFDKLKRCDFPYFEVDLFKILAVPQ